MSFFHKQGPKRSKLIIVKIFSFDINGKFLESFKLFFRDDKVTNELNETTISRQKLLSVIYSYDQRYHDAIHNADNFIYTKVADRTLVEVLNIVNSKQEGNKYDEKIKQECNN